MKETLTIEFIKDHSPRITGEVVTFTGREGIRTANWYLSNGIAKEYCACKDEKHEDGCTECEKLLEARSPMTSKNFSSGNSNTTVKIVSDTVTEPKPPKKKTKK